MTTPYRTDLDALRETKEVLERELNATKQRESQLAGELRNVEDRIRAKTRLPMLDNIRVASPCNASWDEMLGDDRVRFCTSCEKNVFNLSAMSREDAERLLAERMGGELCVRFYQRADGTVMTQDCPVGVTKKRRKLAVLAAAGAGAMALAVTSMMSKTTCTTGTSGLMGKPAAMGELVMGDVGPTETTTPAVMGSAPMPAYTVPPVQNENPLPHVRPTPMQGGLAPTPPSTTPATTSVNHPRMGKPAVVGRMPVTR